MTTQVRFGDYCFYVGAAEGTDDADNLMDLLMEERDIDRNNEEYVDCSCLAVLTTEEVEYLANRMLDAVAYQRNLEKKKKKD